jgi:hypothetical protein
MTFCFLFSLYSLFRECPKAKVLFGFPIDLDMTSPDILVSKRFLMHAAYLLEMIDTALNMLGPDIELLTEIMQELGVKHIRYGVKPEMFPHMGVALLETLEESLGSKFSSSMRESWVETYEALSGDMILAQKNASK